MSEDKNDESGNELPVKEENENQDALFIRAGDIVYQPEQRSLKKGVVNKWYPVGYVVSRIDFPVAGENCKFYAIKTVNRPGFMRGFNQVEILLNHPLDKDDALKMCRALNKNLNMFIKLQSRVNKR